MRVYDASVWRAHHLVVASATWPANKAYRRSGRPVYVARPPVFIALSYKKNPKKKTKKTKKKPKKNRKKTEKRAQILKNVQNPYEKNLVKQSCGEVSG